MDAPEKKASQLESRWIAAITSIALLFGGWWLQNQYDTTMRLQELLLQFMQRVDDRFVEKDYLDQRLTRIEKVLDDLHRSIHEGELERPSNLGGR